MDRRKKGIAIVEALNAQAVKDALGNISPDLADYLVDFAFGDIHGRQGLALEERQLMTITCLTTLGGCEAQLRVHISGALESGHPPEKVMEVLIHCLPYAGFPRVLNAARVFEEVASERGIQLPLKT